MTFYESIKVAFKNNAWGGYFWPEGEGQQESTSVGTLAKPPTPA